MNTESIVRMDLSEDGEEYLDEYGTLSLYPARNISQNNGINYNLFEQVEHILSDLESPNVTSPGFHLLFIVYLIVILVGISGNITVLIAILWKRSMRTPHNLFIAALAVSGKNPLHFKIEDWVLPIKPNAVSKFYFIKVNLFYFRFAFMLVHNAYHTLASTEWNNRMAIWSRDGVAMQISSFCSISSTFLVVYGNCDYCLGSLSMCPA